ncbi:MULTISPECIES: hypothetical protein [unclassified Rhodococcus (in: high G+C Gram-positive bacteria)]|uniref:hypothetical protein n=1 Tax=unclassified Rhodococcus (in: high G+C Gram-positive bacteria) TaxID=192944 RepID=UPI0007BC1D72|nr:MULTISPECIES: hypothetical protein [unclassified Rhodococcus (in: high G+C Gram-positive bacteria)]KZE98468.1 hypothetical protein A2J02_13445 [Rhodococcus sp. EPR-147]KZF07284.1 hypothetical protein A2J04_03280 [Rhodococcus sp. EPR-279]
MKVTGHMSPDEFWRDIDQSCDRVRLGAQGIGLFGLREWDGATMIGDWEWVNDLLSSGGLVHGTPDGDVSVQISTVVGDPRREVVRAIERATGISPWEPDYENRHRAVRDAPGVAVPMLCDGVSVEFSKWGGPDRWWAVGEVDGVSLVIESRNYPVDDVDLIEIDDVEPYLAGWRDYVRSFRGGI